MSSSQSSAKQKQTLRPAACQGAEFDDKPLWNHVKVLNVASGGGGNRTWSCNYCSKKVTGSYTKVKAHLLKLSNHGVEPCKSIRDDVVEAIRKEHDDAEVRKAQQALNARKKSRICHFTRRLRLATTEKTQRNGSTRCFAKVI
ncbi:unnamed protein product [Camellia sinensis]